MLSSPKQHIYTVSAFLKDIFAVGFVIKESLTLSSKMVGFIFGKSFTGMFFNLQALPHNHLLEPQKGVGMVSLLNGREWEDRREMK